MNTDETELCIQNGLLKDFCTFRVQDLFWDRNVNHEFHDEATASNERLGKPAQN